MKSFGRPRGKMAAGPSWLCSLASGSNTTTSDTIEEWGEFTGPILGSTSLVT